MTYGYSGEGYQYLARVLGKILNKSDVELNDYFQEEVVKPLKVKSMNFTWDNKLRPFKAYSHRKGNLRIMGRKGHLIGLVQQVAYILMRETTLCSFFLS